MFGVAGGEVMATNDAPPTVPVRRFVLTWDEPTQCYVVREEPPRADDVATGRYPVITIVVPLVEADKP